MTVDSFYAADQITACFGDFGTHKGVDFEADSGSEIPAIQGGVISGAGYDESRFGNYVTVTADAGTWLYGHMESGPVPAIGSRVNRGDLIGRVGESGNATGPHVHVALLRGKDFVDPAPAIAGVERPLDGDDLISVIVAVTLVWLGFKLLWGPRNA